MPEWLADFIDSFLYLLPWVTGFFVVFAALAKATPCNADQPLVEKGCITDLAYLYIIPIFTRFISNGYMTVGIYLLFREQSQNKVADFMEHGYGPLSHLPIWLQAALVFLISDFFLYWTHRWFHGTQMWKYHAIHHSPVHVSWHTMYRFHPLNIWLSFTLVDTLMLFFGFSLESVTLFDGFNMAYSAMVHANLNWTFGPFRYIFASPVFHRWHHTIQEEGMNKNFAPTFPLLDILFGTFYMPEGRLPEHYGIAGGAPVPEHFLGQMAYPFRRKK